MLYGISNLLSIRLYIIQGGFFMGSKIRISDQGLFIGKEQDLMNIFTFKSKKPNIIQD